MDETPSGFIRDFENALPIALLRAREAVMARFRPLLGRYNLTDQQWRVIRAIADDDGANATTIAERCCILMPSLSRILKTLEADGLALRKRIAGDGRRQRISLTPKGQDLFAEIAPQSEAIYRAIEQEFGAEKISPMLDGLRALEKKLNENR